HPCLRKRTIWSAVATTPLCRQECPSSRICVTPCGGSIRLGWFYPGFAPLLVPRRALHPGLWHRRPSGAEEKGFPAKNIGDWRYDERRSGYPMPSGLSRKGMHKATGGTMYLFQGKAWGDAFSQG